MSTPEQRLAELGIELPTPVAPVANYVPFVQSGNQLVVSGQVAFGPDGLMVGTLGADLQVPQGQAAARLCAINLLAQVSAATGGDLSRVKRVVRLGGFVQVTPDFTDIPQVINGASDLMVAVFGDAGKHARFAVGVAALPLGSAVEVDGMFELTS